MNRPPETFIPVDEDRLLAFAAAAFEKVGLDRVHATLISRLLVNSDHPAAATLLDVRSPAAAPLHSFLRLDVARQLILAVAMDRGIDLGESAPAGTDDESLRSGLEALCETFLSMDLSAAVHMARQEPARFERSLQAGVEFLEDMP